MPMFSKSTNIAVVFRDWLHSPGRGGKSYSQCDQIACKVLKYIKFCCDDVSCSWDVPESVVYYCIGSVSLMSEFVENLQSKWNVGFSGIIGYMNALSHMLDYRRSQTLCTDNIPVFIAAEIYLDRVKKCLSKQMRVQWNVVLSVDYLNSINCWASLTDLQSVIPYHADKFTQILLNSGNLDGQIPAHDLSFVTAFITAVLFIMVKASRPMTFQYLTVGMV